MQATQRAHPGTRRRVRFYNGRHQQGGSEELPRSDFVACGREEQERLTR